MTILCEADQAAAATLVPALHGSVRTVPSLSEVAMTMAADPREQLVVIGRDVPMTQVLSFAGQVRVERPDVAVILVRDAVDARTVAEATGAGIREVVRMGHPRALVEACERVTVQSAPQPSDLNPPAQPPKGHVITVFSAKGGCGKTTIATNLAVALNAGGARTVCLVDLDLAFGDVAISLQLTPNRTLIDAVEVVGNRRDRIDALVTQYLPGLDCVLAPVEPGDAEKVPATLVTELLDELRERYEFVVVDTPAQFSEHVLAALDGSQHHLLLTTPEITALKNLRLTLDMLDLLSYSQDSRSIVLNRSGADVGLTKAEIEDAIRSPIALHVPSTRDVPISINRGVPLCASKPDHEVSQAIRAFADTAIVGQRVERRRRFGRRSKRSKMPAS